MVTAPIHKEALAAAGIGYPGHTEMLQALARAGEAPAPVRMMLANDELRVVLVTIHRALRRAIEVRRASTRCCDTLRIAHAQRGLGSGCGTAHRGGRPEPACRRRRACSATRSIASSPRRSPRRAPKASTRSGPFAPGHGVHACAPRRRPSRRVRRGGGDDPRPRPDPGEVPGRRAGRQRHARPAVRAHQPGPRHGLRHRRAAAVPTPSSLEAAMRMARRMVAVTTAHDA